MTQLLAAYHPRHPRVPDAPQRRRTPAERRVVRHAQAEAEQADDGTEQALGLPVEPGGTPRAT